MTPPFLHYGRQLIDEADIAAVNEVLRSDWLTTGPQIDLFEEAVARYVGSSHAVAVANGTAALHAAMHAIGIGPGDEVIVPATTFVATANCVLYAGGTPVFADVEANTLLIDPEDVAKKITGRTRAIIGVDYAGQPADYDRLRQLADQHGLFLIADACHSLGAEDRGRKVGILADMTVFSFHPVKHITTGEGGMVVTNNTHFAGIMKRFRSHGITADHRQREKQGTWYYEMTELGYNYRITDFQAALGRSQLRKLPGFLARRRQIAALYEQGLAPVQLLLPLAVRSGVKPAFHLYVVRLPDGTDRSMVFQRLRDRGVGVNVHYLPVYLHPYYRKRFGYGVGFCPTAEAAYDRILSLPMHPGLTDADVERVVDALSSVMEGQCRINS